MSASLDTVRNILGYNTWLFQMAVKDVAADRFAYRVDDRTNAFDRLAGHVTVCRHGTAGMLHIPVPELSWGSFGEFGIGTQFEPERICPPLPKVTSVFEQVTEALMGHLAGVPDEVFDEPAAFDIPGEDPTMRDLLDFMVMHETYHIGQLGLLKKSMSGRAVMDG